MAAFFVLKQLNRFLELVLGNIFYLVLITVAGLGGAIILYRLVDQGKISTRGAAAGYIVILAVTLAIPVAGMQVTQFATSYSADITVNTGQFSGLNTVTFENLQVSNVERTGPKIFSMTEQACIFCGDWVVQADVTCTREGKQVYSRQATLTGKGGASDTVSINGLPANAQCTVRADMTTPADHQGLQNPTSRFVTGE